MIKALTVKYNVRLIFLSGFITDDMSKWRQNHSYQLLSLYMFLFLSDPLPLPKSSKVQAMLPAAFLMLEKIEEPNNTGCVSAATRWEDQTGWYQ